MCLDIKMMAGVGQEGRQTKNSCCKPDWYREPAFSHGVVPTCTL